MIVFGVFFIHCLRFFARFQISLLTMALPTPVNGQITDAVTQANVQVLGGAPAQALASLYQVTAQALANAAHNATSAQQQAAIVAQAVTTRCVQSLLADSKPVAP